MKRSFTGRLAAVTAVLCLVTMSLTSGTLAKYASSAAGNATATVAKWKIAFSDGTTEFADSSNIVLNLKDTVQEDANLVATDKIAPGTSGSFNLKVDGSNAEVAFTYSITLDVTGVTTEGTTSGTCPLKFYKTKTGDTYSDEITDSTPLTNDVLLNASSKTATETIYWVWDTASSDDNDTLLGTDSAKITAGLVYKIPVTITATQKTTV